jgi:tRNA pseudouridine13 synthase
MVLLNVPPLEKEVGIEVYASETPGVGGKIRQFPEDFIVEEILVDSSEASVSPASIPQIDGRGRYLVCVLVKRDWDTLRAVENIAKRLGISEEYIQIAGIKDAKAFTAQHVSISCFSGITPDQVLRVKSKDISLHPQRFSNEKISSQILLGNRFKIKIIATSYSSSTVKRRIKNVLDELADFGGIPNFFGHQRFGTIRPITHKVGKFIVQGDWEKATLTYLCQHSPYEHPQSRKARQQLQTSRDFKEAQQYFPRTLHYERSMLRHLAGHPRDYVGAFRKLPPKLCKLFIQAYQSFLFNKFLSQRIKECIPLNEAQKGDYIVDVGKNGLPTSTCSKTTAESPIKTKEALNKGKIRIAIPLIGFKQQPSNGVQGEIEQEILGRENVAPQDFHISSMPKMSVSRGLRAIITPIQSFLFSLPENEAKLSFTLHKGSYATVLLREFMKPQDPINAGF